MRRPVIFQLALVACSSGINVWGHQWRANHSSCHGHQFKPTATPGCSQSNLLADPCFLSRFFGSTSCCLKVCLQIWDWQWTFCTWSPTSIPCYILGQHFHSPRLMCHTMRVFVMPLDFGFFCETAGSFMYFLWWYCTITDVFVVQITNVLPMLILQNHWFTCGANTVGSLIYQLKVQIGEAAFEFDRETNFHILYECCATLVNHVTDALQAYHNCQY